MASLLIVEDDGDLREGLAFAFQSEGYQVLETDTVRRARHFLQHDSIQGVLLDCNLTDGNGFDFCEEIRQSSGVPVMMLILVWHCGTVWYVSWRWCSVEGNYCGSM